MVGGYIATIPAANFMIGNVGTFCIPDGPCMIPVGFGLSAPSGVLMVGAALVLRDAVQEAFGAKWAFASVILGVVISYLLADPWIAFASLTAFALSELLDFAVYTYIRVKGRALAVLMSGIVGAIADSAAFLYIAFGSFDYISGQIIGKLFFTVIVAALLQAKLSWQK